MPDTVGSRSASSALESNSSPAVDARLELPRFRVNCTFTVQCGKATHPDEGKADADSALHSGHGRMGRGKRPMTLQFTISGMILLRVKVQSGHDE
jgi:hypothetical protein